jgi:hypothetical protein
MMDYRVYAFNGDEYSVTLFTGSEPGFIYYQADLTGRNWMTDGLKELFEHPKPNNVIGPFPSPFLIPLF